MCVRVCPYVRVYACTCMCACACTCALHVCMRMHACILGITFRNYLSPSSMGAGDLPWAVRLSQKSLLLVQPSLLVQPPLLSLTDVSI